MKYHSASKTALLFLLSSLVLTPNLIASRGGQEGGRRGERRGEEVQGNERKEPRRHKKGSNKRDITQMLSKKLNLTEEQKKAAHSIHEAIATKRKALKDQIKSLQEEMDSLQKGDSSNSDRMIQIGGELGSLRVKQRLLTRQFFDELKPLLDESQKVTLAKMKEKFSGKRGKRNRQKHKRGAKSQK